MNVSTKPTSTSLKKADFEFVLIPEGRSFLWRKDDYPWIKSVYNFHPEFEIHLIRHSYGMAYVGDYVGNFEAGQLVLVGGNLPHNWVTPIQEDEVLESRDVVVQFDPGRILRAASEIPELNQLEPLLKKAALGVEFLGDTAKLGAQMLENMENKQGFSQLCGLFELLALMSKSTEYRSLASPRYVEKFRPGAPHEVKLMDVAMDYIQSHYLSNIKLKDVSALVDMSESAFSRFFQAQIGNSFTHHIKRLRILAACRLLSDSKIPITSLCYQCGYNNISIFNRNFLKQTGMTPSQYRKSYAE